MSLLTSDHKRKSKFFSKVISFSTILSIISFISGVGYFGYLIHEPDKTYFSDNGLLPGLALREFTYTKLAEQYLSELENISSTLIPIAYLKEKFQNDFGLGFYEHEFTLKYPFIRNRFHYTGHNVYAILRAPRAASTEALVISTPYRSSENVHGSTLPSVALMLALAKFFTTKHYWAKDLIFLIADKELVGVQSWLNAYHALPESEWLVHGKLGSASGTSGVIQAAINLELHTFKPRSIDIKIEGINGQLPNLDLFNVAVELCNRESLSATFHGDSFSGSASFSSGGNFEWQNFLQNALTLASMMTTQATTLPSGAHGLFQRYAIQAITLETHVDAFRTTSISNSALNIGRAVEGIIRSLNNLQQRFHRSFWFYLLPSTRRYISIGYYMIAFGLLCLPLALRALKLYRTAGNKISLFIFFNFDNFCFFLPVKTRRNHHHQLPNQSHSLWVAFEGIFLAYLFGIIALSVPLILSRIEYGHWWLVVTATNEQTTADLFYSIFIALSVVSLIPLFIQLEKTQADLDLQLMVSLLNCTLLFASISLVNISLALALTSIYVPFIFIIQALHPPPTMPSTVDRSVTTIIRSLIQRTLLLMIHPMTLHFACLLILSVWIDQDNTEKNVLNTLKISTIKDHFLNGDPIGFTMKHMTRTFESHRKTILYYIEDWYLYDNWSYPLVCLGLFPVWLQFWYASLVKADLNADYIIVFSKRNSVRS